MVAADELLGRIFPTSAIRLLAIFNNDCPDSIVIPAIVAVPWRFKNPPITLFRISTSELAAPVPDPIVIPLWVLVLVALFDELKPPMVLPLIKCLPAVALNVVALNRIPLMAILTLDAVVEETIDWILLFNT